MDFLLVQILFSAFVGQCFSAAVGKVDCHLDRLTACGDPLAEFRKEMGSNFPTDLDQVNKLCKRMDETQDCVEKFKQQCMLKTQTQTIEFLTEGSLDAYKDFCTVGSQTRTDYLKHVKCIDKASKSEEAKANYRYIEAALESFADKEPSDRLSTACCGYAWLNENSKKIGEASCGADAVEAFEKVVTMATSSLPSVICSGFIPESDTCKAALPPPGSEPQGTLKNSSISNAFADRFSLKDLY